MELGNAEVLTPASRRSRKQIKCETATDARSDGPIAECCGDDAVWLVERVVTRQRVTRSQLMVNFDVELVIVVDRGSLCYEVINRSLSRDECTRPVLRRIKGDDFGCDGINCVRT